ncbi:hypothetical protein CR513_28722, partial [Mucuna pruriens]
MINDAFGIPDTYQGPYEFVENMPNEESEKIGDLVRDCNQNFYEGYQKYSKLSFLLRLYHIKCLCGVIDKAMMMILELLKDAFEYAYGGKDENLEICKHCTNGKKKLPAKNLEMFTLALQQMALIHIEA